MSDLKRDSGKVKWLTFLLVAVVVLSVASVQHMKRQVPPPPMPRPNGFWALALAAKKAEWAPAGIYDWPPERLKLFVASNSVPMQLANLALTNECRIPYLFDSSYITTRTPELVGLKYLATIFSAASMVASNEAKFDAAMDYCLQGIQLGNESDRGGTMFDRLVGNACEANCLIRATFLSNLVSRSACTKLVKELERLDAAAETTEDVLENERRWARSALTLPEWIEQTWEEKSLTPYKSTIEGFVKVDLKHRRKRLETMLLFAARAYELDHGKPPARAADLVPEYLKAIPKDPETGVDMALKR